MGTSAEKAEALPHRSTVIATDAAKSGSRNGMGRGRRCDKDEAVLPEKDIMAFGFGFVGNSLWGLSFFFCPLVDRSRSEKTEKIILLLRARTVVICIVLARVVCMHTVVLEY